MPSPACNSSAREYHLAANVAERSHAVEVATSFIKCLESIDDFLAEADASYAYDSLLTMLRAEVIPNLRRFPNMGSRYLEQPPRSVEALALLADMPPDAADSLRTFLVGDILILYVVNDARRIIALLSILHHRQLSFDFTRIWGGKS